MKRVFLFVCILVLALATAALGEGGDGEIRILVIETTDMHGYLMDASSGKEETFQYRLACIAGAVNEARASGLYDDVLLIDGGDIYQGVPISNMTAGAAMRAAMELMRYDAVALGNHEFDWDVTEYAADRHGTIAPYVLGDYFGDPNTPVLASDLYDAETGERVPFTKDHIVVEKAGQRIAVVGYIPDYSGGIKAEKIAPYTIDGDLGKLDALVREINERERPDATIVLAHEEPEPVALAMDRAQVALVAGGHSHQITAKEAENGIACIQGNCNGSGFASAVLVFSQSGVAVEDIRYTDITADKTRLYDTEENAARLDPEIMEISQATWDAVQAEMSEVLGYIDTPILKDGDPGANSAGNWITGLILRFVKEYDAVAAFYNNGGIRTSFKIPAGEETRGITVYNVYTIAPFDDYLLVFEVSGPELARQLADGLSRSNCGDQMSGLTFTYTVSGGDGEKEEYAILSITLDDGTEVDLEDEDTLYRVCTTSYCATVSGSVFLGKESLIPETEAIVANEAMIRMLREEARENGGRIAVDDGERGVQVEAETALLREAAD